MATDWKAGEFVAASPQANGSPVRTRVAGWINEPFALDWRMLEDEDGDCNGGWVLTHIPTGYAVQKMRCPLPEAMEIAGKIRAMGDWNFTKPEDCAAYREPMRALRKTIVDADHSHDEAIGPMGKWGLLA